MKTQIKITNPAIFARIAEVSADELICTGEHLPFRAFGSLHITTINDGEKTTQTHTGEFAPADFELQYGFILERAAE